MVGVADETLGEKVVAIVTLRDLELKFQTAQDDAGTYVRSLRSFLCHFF